MQYAYSLVSQLNGLPAGEQRKALVARIRAEAERAKSLGASSKQLQTLQGFLDNGSLAAPPSQEAQELAAAEGFFPAW